MNISVKFLILLLPAIPMASTASINIDIYCFTSGDKNPIQFELREYTDTSIPLSSAFVKYRHSSAWIPLVATESNSSTLSKEVPAEITTVWLEVVGKTLSGFYEMVSQGTMVSSMRYTKFPNKKTYDFIRDTGIEFSAQKGCSWMK